MGASKKRGWRGDFSAAPGRARKKSGAWGEIGRPYGKAAGAFPQTPAQRFRVFVEAPRGFVVEKRRGPDRGRGATRRAVSASGAAGL